MSFIIFVAAAVAVFFSAVKIVPQKSVLIIERMGKFHK
jgi:regulator of protease activity HflC (stomatin/prohibitin superfamily)